MIEKRFQAFKVSTDGHHRKWDHVEGLSLSDIRSDTRFPLGRHVETSGIYEGIPYIWSESLMERYL